MTQSPPYLPPRPDANGTIHIVVPLRPGADLDQLRARLDAVPALKQRAVRWHVPKARADIVQLSQEAARSAKADGGLVVAAGGDGTINAVATAAWAQGVPMGVLPMGTFNYFARDQSLSLDPQEAVQDVLTALDGGDMRPVSVGFVNDRMFLVNASVGLYPRLLDNRERASRRFGRTRWVAILSSMWSVLRGGASRRWRVSVRPDANAPLQQQEHLVSTLFVGNNHLQLERVGIPEAREVAEGDHLAVVVLKPQEGDASPASMLWNAVRGKLGEDESVSSIACTEMIVEPASWKPHRVKVAFDGEREWMAPPINFRVGDRPLWLVAPTATVKSDDPAPAAQAEEAPAVPAVGLAPV
ncbi:MULTISPECIES: diacylglycerol kinase family protein [unclassified Acidovorax]|uniref:diacylglycerol/lipid kinase family protein n=1 Tax=unclassified Acidovorax TaxID=2684926 RepID=UPI0028831D63|nr:MULTISPECIES: diacylglycerol kinase family protein [unclassified Acidovorax]